MSSGTQQAQFATLFTPLCAPAHSGAGLPGAVVEQAFAKTRSQLQQGWNKDAWKYPFKGAVIAAELPAAATA